MVGCRPRRQKRSRGSQGPVTGRAVLSGEASAILRDQLLAEIGRVGSQRRSRRLDTARMAKGKYPDAGRWGQGQTGVSSPAQPAPDRYRMRTSRQPNGTSQRQTKRSAPASTKACWQSPMADACGTSPTCGSWPNSLASSAGASPAMPTICGLRNPAVSASRSATNSRSRCAGHTIANCTAPARKSDWWAKAGLEPISLARKLWLETHPLHASADVLGDDSEKPGAANDEVTAMSRQPREPRMAKRTQLPGTPT